MSINTPINLTVILLRVRGPARFGVCVVGHLLHFHVDFPFERRRVKIHGCGTNPNDHPSDSRLEVSKGLLLVSVEPTRLSTCGVLTHTFTTRIIRGSPDLFCLLPSLSFVCLLPILKRLDNNPAPTESHKAYSVVGRNTDD